MRYINFTVSKGNERKKGRMKKKGKKNKKNNKVGKENVVVAVADSDDESADDERSVVWHATMTRDCG